MLEGLKILLAEDNPTNQMVAVQMLEALGAGVTVAADGVEALAIVERDAFDILLIDIEMPRKNGIDVIRTLRASGGRNAGLPMIALTAYVMREHRQAIDAAGADGVIAKPIISIAEFGRQLLDLCGPRRRAAGPLQGRDASRASADPDAQHGSTAGGPVSALAARPTMNMATLAMLREAVGIEALAEILEKAEADLLDAGAQISQGFASGNPDAVRRGLHILTGLAGTVGAERLEAAARACQDAAQADDQRAAETFIQSLSAEITAALAGLGAARAG
ncbi:MAG: response regulator [Thermohalobaculum sp.]|nr:response regulator [Thermohalobaculum sp.]